MSVYSQCISYKPRRVQSITTKRGHGVNELRELLTKRKIKLMTVVSNRSTVTFAMPQWCKQTSINIGAGTSLEGVISFGPG